MDTTKLSYKVNDHVNYRRHGVYLISDIRKEKICGITKTYYVLNSVYDGNSTVYVPADCDELVGRIEQILTVDEINSIIDESKKEDHEWIPVTAARAVALEEIVKSEDLCEILRMLKLLTLKKEETLRNRGKTFAHDERMLSYAQKTITEAFAFSLGINKSEVIPYIIERLSESV